LGGDFLDYRSQSQARFVRTLNGKVPTELLQTIDDVAFAFGRFRLGSCAAATRWEAFKAAATGYLVQHRFWPSRATFVPAY
jgi:hypothetical protein